MRGRVFAFCALAVLTGIPAVVQAVVSTNTWVAGNGSYTNAAKWGPAVVPNNNNGTGDTYVARIDGGNGTASAVVLDTVGFAIDRLIVSAGDSLTITNADDLTIQVGMTITGTVALASDGSGAYLHLIGTQTIDGTGQILMTGTFPNNLIFANNGGTVTVGSGITIHGAGTIRGDVANPMVNQGTISADLNGQTLVLQDFVNQGRLSAVNGGTLQLQGNWSNTGVISNNAGIISLAGMFTTASLSTLKTINGTNILDSGGILINTNSTFTLNPATTGSLRMNSGTIRGGTVTTAGGAQFIFGSATFDGVTLNSDITISFGSLGIMNGLTNNATITTTNSPIGFSGSQTLAGTGQVVFACVTANNDGFFPSGGALTIGPSMTVRGGGGLILPNNPFFPTLNLGTIISERSNFTTTVYYFDNRNLMSGVGFGNLNLFNFTNSGTISVSGGGSLTINEFNNTGTIRASGGTLLFDGNWVNSGVISGDVSTISMGGTFTTASALGIIHTGGSTIMIAGTMDNSNNTFTLSPATGSWRLGSGGTIQGGTINATGGAQLIPFVNPSNFNPATLDGVTLNTDLAMTNISVNVKNGLTNNATITIGSGLYLLFNSGLATLAGTGQVVNIGGYVYSTSGTFTFGAGQTVRCFGGNIYSDSVDPIFNLGTITSETNLTTTIQTYGASFVNQGRVNVLNGGTLTAQNMTNTGTVTINSSSTFGFFGNYVQTAGNTVLNGGNLTPRDGGSVRILGGSVSGTGFIDGTVTNAGTITPGNSAGLLTFTGDLALQGSSLMKFEIGGNTQGSQYDFVAVSNNLNVAGNLTVTLINGFIPANGSSFTVVTSGGSIGGTFINATNGNRIATLDSAGSFLYLQNANSIVLDDFQPSITPYLQWALGYFGCTNCAQSLELADPDGDGANNHNEFYMGTDPTNAISYAHITSIKRQTNDMVIAWQGVGGRTNILQAGTSASGSYPTNFVDIPPQVILSGIGASNTNQVDAGGATNKPARYYRIKLVP